MAIEVFEAHDSRATTITADGSGNSREVKFFVTGTDDVDDATNAILNQLQASLQLGNASRIVIADALQLEQIGPQSFSGSMDYEALQTGGGGGGGGGKGGSGVNKPTAVGEVVFSFDGSGGTHRLKEAYSQTKYGVLAPDHKNLINVNDQGEVEGVEILIPQLTLTVTQKFAGETITLPWLRSLIFATGAVNSDSFLGFEPGEALFLGPSGQQPLHFMSDGSVKKGDRDVTFRFAISPNRTDLAFGDITGVSKPGHDFLWPAYMTVPDETHTAMTRKQVGVYVAQTYPRFAFADLGLKSPDIDFPVVGV